MNEYNLKCYYFVDQYTKSKTKYCTRQYNSYNTVAEAKEACNVDLGCEAIYDNNCDESPNDVYLCPIGTSYGVSSTSCIYEKGKI